MDGIQLIAGESQPTVIMPTPTSAPTVASSNPRKSRVGLWAGLAVMTLLFGGIILAGLLYYVYRLGNESAIANRNSVSNSTPQTRNTATSRSTSQPTQTTSPPPANTAGDPDNDTSMDPDDATPITWSTSTGTFRVAPGLTYTFVCPPEGTPGAVWGSNPYTTDSSICTAAVHAGEITLEEGGEVTIEIRPGRQTFGATTRNGITTYPYGQFPHSMVFIDDSKTAN
jgi:hypothetical protein